MYSLVNLLPWYFWVLWGIIGGPIIAFWVIKSKDDPILLKLSWLLMALLSIFVAMHSYMKGSGSDFAYWRIIDQMSIPLLITAVLLMIVGGYQKVIRPGYDLEKRRMFIKCIYIALGLFVGWGILLGISYYR